MQNTLTNRNRIRWYVPTLAGMTALLIVAALWQYGPVWVVSDTGAPHQTSVARQGVRLSGDPMLDIGVGLVSGAAGVVQTTTAAAGFLAQMAILMFLGFGGALMILICAMNSIEGHCMCDKDGSAQTIRYALGESRGHAIAVFVAVTWLSVIFVPLWLGRSDTSVADCTAKCIILSGNAWLQ